MVCYDQLDITNLASAELICRQIQLIEYKYQDRLPISSSSTDADAHLFMGQGSTRGGAYVLHHLLEIG
eukprot:1654947-Karenia_brevis.AAC.1